MKTPAQVILGLVLLLLPLTAGAQDDPAADARRIQELRAKRDRGESLSDDERAFVRQMLAKRRGTPSGRSKDAPPGDWSALVPLTDLGGSYKGEDGGLYGQRKNEPPPAHRSAYLQESAKIRPLDAGGRPAPEGIIGLVTIGFSNTNLESMEFKTAANADPQKSPRVVIVNGAIGGRSAVMWAYDGAECLPMPEQQRLDKAMDQARMPKANRRRPPGVPAKDTWPTLDQRLKREGLSPRQVQAVWLKQVEAGPRTFGDFPAHAKALEADMADILIIAKKRFPNLRVALLSSRTYAGWAGPNCGSPEPFAYESAFGVRWLIRRQIQGDPQLNYDAARGEVKSPLLLWGPYLWACGNRPRKSDGAVWSQQDVRPDDHMHPSQAGCRKVTEMLLKFLKSDAGTRRWFVKP
jgi:hypothetical protein